MGKTVSSSVNPCTHGQVEGTIPYQRAAALLGITPKQLASRIWRDKVGEGDPVGCKVCGDVYTWSLPVHDPALFMEREQTANDSSVVQP